MKKKLLGFTACMLALSIVLNGAGIYAKSPKKVKLKTKKLSLQVGKKKTIQLKNKKKNAAYTYKSTNTKVAKVTKKGVVTALKAGKAKISVKEKIGKKTKHIGNVAVTVTASKNQPNQTQTTPVATPPAPTAAQTIQPPAGTQSSSQTPTPAPEQTASPKPPVNPEIQEVTPKKLHIHQDKVTYGTQVNEQYDSSTTGKKRNVIIILPNGYTEEIKYPVLYLFHGGMGDENDWVYGNVLNMIGNMIAEGEAEEMILVLPNCRCREDDSAANADGFSLGHVQSFDHFLDDFRDNLMPYMENNYSVATGRDNTAVAGLSMGGRVSLNIGFSLPDQVGYVGAFSPAYGIFPYTNNGLTEEGLFTEDTFTLPEPYKNSTFVLINTGNQDNMVSGEPARYHEALEKNGVHHTYYTIDGSHDWPVWRNGFYNFARYLFK